MVKSLRYRLLTWFVFSTILISASSFVLIKTHNSAKRKEEKTTEDLSYFRNQFLKDQVQVAGFLSTETSNKDFYLTGESEFLFSHYRHSQNVDSCYLQFMSNNELPTNEGDILTDIRQIYSNYCTVFDSLIFKIYQHGYGNLGLQGELAGYMYRLEQINDISKSEIIQLKLSEKEYSTRCDTAYVVYVNRLCNSLITNALNNSRYSVSEKKEVVKIIKSYRTTFNNIVKIDREIGKNNISGLKHELSEISYQLEDLIDGSILEANQVFKANMKKINLIYFVLTLMIILTGFLLSGYTSKAILKNLENLTVCINKFTKNEFDSQFDFDLRNSTIEVRQIYLEFRNLLSDLKMRERQRDRALRVAEENQQRYQDLAGLLPQCIYETDRFGNLIYINKAWNKVFGYSSSDVEKGINILDVLDNNPVLKGHYSSKKENNEYVATRKDGSQFPVSVYTNAIKKGVRVTGKRGIIIDSTYKYKYIESLKKEAERAVSSDKHKSSFLANMSHEIRTPMNSIIGFANMLASKEVPDEIKNEFIGHIQTSSEILLNLIDDIIDIAKIEDGQLKIKKTSCEVQELSENLMIAFNSYKSRFEKDDIEIRSNIPLERLCFRTDTFRLQQIITNLMSNAIKFTEKGSVEFGVKIKNPSTLEFYVKDTGIGMSKDDLRNVFERFKRAKLSEEKKISGTGLGLAISKNLVEMLGGNMWVTSQPGRGSCFSFELPYLRVEEMSEPTKVVKSEPIILKGKKLLVAEDDNTNFEVISHLLEPTQAEIIRANNGREAIEAVSFHKDIALIIMDLRMPYMNGLEATSLIKEDFPELPIIAQTAFAMQGDRNKCLEAGCDDYIPKPINAADLFAKIGQFIKPSLSNQFSLDQRNSKANKQVENEKSIFNKKDLMN